MNGSIIKQAGSIPDPGEIARLVESEEIVVAEVAEIIELAKLPEHTCIARQPVFDTSMQVYAYELLYANERVSESESPSDNESSSQVMINAFLDVGIETVSDNLPAFIRVTRDFLTGELPLPFPPNAVVLEVPADLPADANILTGMRYYSDAGFRFAITGYTFREDLLPFMDLVDIVKIDVGRCDPDILEQNIVCMQTLDATLIAENVSTHDEYALCKAAGIGLFQGSFISTPVAVSGNVLKPNRLALLKILELLEDPDCDIAVLEELISQDVTLSYKILRIINSAFYGFRRKIDSVKQAVVSLGLKVIRDWFIVISLTDIEDKPEELIFITLQRARMMQSLSEIMCLNKDTGFTTGLFSSIDAIMDQPMATILESLPLSSEITEALLHREGTLGQLLDIVLHYEQGNWQHINNIGFEPSELSTYYFEAMYWARGLFEQIKSENKAKG